MTKFISLLRMARANKKRRLCQHVNYVVNVRGGKAGCDSYSCPDCNTNNMDFRPQPKFVR